MKKSTEREEAIKRLDEDYRRQQKEKEEEEWIRLQTTGGSSET